MAATALAIGVASRPFPGESTNGDAWAIDWHGDVCRVAVVDGLGHGPEAARAAQTAVEVLRARPDAQPGEALELLHQALRGTRGAAVSLARIDPAAGRLVYAGIGNVEARLWLNDRQERPIVYRGVVGVTMPTRRQFEFALSRPWRLLVHSDGVSGRARPEALPEFATGDPQMLAEAVLGGWARDTDDATVLVVAPA